MTRWVRWLGLAVVLLAAAVLSFDALRGLALAVRIPDQLAWLLPIAVDAGASVSCACWLSREVPGDAARWARGMTWSLLAVTVVGNAGSLGMHAYGIAAPWWVAVAVGAIPPGIVGAGVHLAVLVGRSVVEPEPATRAAATGSTLVAADPPALPPARETWEEQVDRLVLVEGLGRRRLADELGITEHAARALIDERQGRTSASAPGGWPRAVPDEAGDELAEVTS